jgi:cysteine desulfurase
VRAYLDHAATSPLSAEAAAAMAPWLAGRFGNPSGSHSVARAARAALEEAREELGRFVGTPARQVVFTSGGTESDNLAVRGAVGAAGGGAGAAVVVSAVEHAAVLGAAAASGAQVRTVGVDRAGVVDLDRLADALDEAVAVVSVMLANNEVGTLEPLAEVAALVRRRSPRALLHTDAVQAARWCDLGEVVPLVDLLSVSAHKLGGPQGVGALVVGARDRIAPLLRGGSQEGGLRPGTHNVAGIVGFAAAATATAAGRGEAAAATAARRDRLVAEVLARVEGVELLAGATPRVASIAAFVVEGVESEALLLLLDQAGVAASAGAACASGALEASHVLLAMGVPRREALASLRVSLAPRTTDAEVDAFLDALPVAVGRLRAAPARRDRERV